MQPVPCNHCGYNFMRKNLDPDAPKLCNSCEVRENIRNPQGNKMDTIGILIQCPKDEHIIIEELCINEGIDLTRYFLDLHHASQVFKGQEYKENVNLKIDGTSPVKDAYMKLEEKPKSKEKKK